VEFAETCSELLRKSLEHYTSICENIGMCLVSRDTLTTNSVARKNPCSVTKSFSDIRMTGATRKREREREREKRQSHIN